MVACTCNTSYFGGWGMKTTWTWEAEVAVSQDCTTVFQPGWWSETLSKKEKRRDLGRKLIAGVTSTWKVTEAVKLYRTHREWVYIDKRPKDWALGLPNVIAGERRKSQQKKVEKSIQKVRKETRYVCICFCVFYWKLSKVKEKGFIFQILDQVSPGVGTDIWA